MDNKRFKVYITIFVITTIIASCFAVYFAIESSNKNPKNIKVGKVESVATDEVEKTETKVEINEVEKYVFPKIDSTKCLNSIDGVSYYVKRNVRGFNGGFRAYIESSNMIKIEYTTDEFLKLFTKLNVENSPTVKTAEILLDKKVANIYLGNGGHEYEGKASTLFFVMEDGTIQYMPIIDALINSNFKSYGTINGIENVVEIVSGSVNGEIGGHLSVFAITNTGAFYDVFSVLNKTEIYKKINDYQLY